MQVILGLAHPVSCWHYGTLPKVSWKPDQTDFITFIIICAHSDCWWLQLWREVSLTRLVKSFCCLNILWALKASESTHHGTAIIHHSCNSPSSQFCLTSVSTRAYAQKICFHEVHTTAIKNNILYNMFFNIQYYFCANTENEFIILSLFCTLVVTSVEWMIHLRPQPTDIIVRESH